MDIEIQQSERVAEEVEIIVEEDGKEVVKTIKASFKTASQLPRHTKSNKIFDSLYDDTKPIVLVQCGALWFDKSQKDKISWFTTQDGPRLNILGLYGSFKEAVLKSYTMKKLILKHGYRLEGMCAYPNREWIVLRRNKPMHVHDDKLLTKHIINYRKRFTALTEIDFAKEIRQKDRPLVKPPPKPLTLAHMYPQSLTSYTNEANKIRQKTIHAIKHLTNNKSLSHKQFIKAKSKIKKMEKKQLKKLRSHIPSKSRDKEQNFAAIAYLTSPRYMHVDETKYFGCKAPDNEKQQIMCLDPDPEKIYSETDFDEAMLICVIRTFRTEEKCNEFIDNKAKHDFDFCSVVCVELYENIPLDYMLTEEYAQFVQRTYLTDLQNKCIIDREVHAKQSLKRAKEKPDFVQEIFKNKDGKIELKQSKATEVIKQALDNEKARCDELFEESKNKPLKEIEGGASKDLDSNQNEVHKAEIDEPLNNEAINNEKVDE